MIRSSKNAINIVRKIQPEMVQGSYKFDNYHRRYGFTHPGHYQIRNGSLSVGVLGGGELFLTFLKTWSQTL
jgi:hypothetical protein